MTEDKDYTDCFYIENKLFRILLMILEDRGYSVRTLGWNRDLANKIFSEVTGLYCVSLIDQQFVVVNDEKYMMFLLRYA